VLDCTALRLAASTPEDRPPPVVATWDESEGWCVGLHHDPSHASRRYLHPDVLPVPRVVADFVVGLALGQPLGAADSIAGGGGRPRLRLVT
jgi:Family of unknown function (DUF6292)